MNVLVICDGQLKTHNFKKKNTFDPFRVSLSSLSFHNVLPGRDNFIHSTCCSCLHAGFASVSHAVGSEEKMKSKLHGPADRRLNEIGMEIEKCGGGRRGGNATGSEEGCG